MCYIYCCRIHGNMTNLTVTQSYNVNSTIVDDSGQSRWELTSRDLWILVTGVTGGLSIILLFVYMILYHICIQPYQKIRRRRGKNYFQVYTESDLWNLEDSSSNENRRRSSYRWIFYHGLSPEERQNKKEELKLGQGSGIEKYSVSREGSGSHTDLNN